MEGVDRIVGAEQLVAVFDRWPSFHDAEVLWLRLDRRPPTDGGYGPTLEALVHTFEMTSEERDGYYVLRHHVLVHLRFSKLVELRLDDFNHQNALMGLGFTDIRDRQMEGVKWEVQFDGAFGVDASFQCAAIEVVSVVRCDERGEPLAE